MFLKVTQLVLYPRICWFTIKWWLFPYVKYVKKECIRLVAHDPHNPEILNKKQNCTCSTGLCCVHRASAGGVAPQELLQHGGARTHHHRLQWTSPKNPQGKSTWVCGLSFVSQTNCFHGNQYPRSFLIVQLFFFSPLMRGIQHVDA